RDRKMLARRETRNFHDRNPDRKRPVLRQRPGVLDADVVAVGCEHGRLAAHEPRDLRWEPQDARLVHQIAVVPAHENRFRRGLLRNSAPRRAKREPQREGSNDPLCHDVSVDRSTLDRWRKFRKRRGGPTGEFRSPAPHPYPAARKERLARWRAIRKSATMFDEALISAARVSKAWPFQEAMKLVKRYPDGKPG